MNYYGLFTMERCIFNNVDNIIMYIITLKAGATISS